ATGIRSFPLRAALPIGSVAVASRVAMAWQSSGFTADYLRSTAGRPSPWGVSRLRGGPSPANDSSPGPAQLLSDRAEHGSGDGRRDGAIAEGVGHCVEQLWREAPPDGDGKDRFPDGGAELRLERLEPLEVVEAPRVHAH